MTTNPVNIPTVVTIHPPGSGIDTARSQIGLNPTLAVELDPNGEDGPVLHISAYGIVRTTKELASLLIDLAASTTKATNTQEGTT